MRTLIRICTLALVLFYAPCAAHAEDVRFTSLEWPPYTGADLPEQGASTKVAMAAFEASGMALQVAFRPWMRAVDEAKSDAAVAGYFPEYHADSIEAEFIFSERMGDSPLGFVERVADPIQWAALEDLKPYAIGTVDGYVNTAEFDAMAAAGDLKIDPVTDDATNLKKLARGRIDLAVMDRNVFHYLMQTDPSLQEFAGQLQFNETLMENKGLYLCFTKRDGAQALVDAFNAGLQKVNYQTIEAEYLKQVLEQ